MLCCIASVAGITIPAFVERDTIRQYLIDNLLGCRRDYDPGLR